MELRKNIHFVLFAVLLSLMKEGIRKGGYAFRIKRGGIIDAEERSIVMKKQQLFRIFRQRGTGGRCIGQGF